MNRLLTALFAGTALMATATAANATIITTAAQTVTFGTLATDWTQSGTFNLFDTNLGTLQSIILGDGYSETSAITVTNAPNSNPAGPNASGYARAETVLTLSSSVSGINSVITSQLANGATLDVLGAKYTFSNLAPSASAGGSSNGSLSLSGVSDSTSSDLLPFEATGGGTAPVSGTTLTSTVLSYTGGNASAVQTTTSNGSFTIQYVYDDSTAVPTGPTPMPEPASMALLGAGLLGAGLVRRRASK